MIATVATWCMYCGYMDKWILPRLARIRGVAVDIVVVSPAGGIANPGPFSPAYTGSAAPQGNALSLSGMESNLREYLAAYAIAGDGINAYIAPELTQAQWQVTELPTIAFVDARGRVVRVAAGGMTLGQAESMVHDAE